MTQSGKMNRVLAMCAATWCAAAAGAQAGDESLRVYAEHPRLLLSARRLRLLERERERQSMRFNQFHALMAGKAPMPEPGFAEALYYRVSHDEDAGKRAVQWALGPSRDLRQLALVFDWCQDALTPSQAGTLAGRLAAGIAQSQADASVRAVRSRLFAAIALAGHRDQVSDAEIARVVHGWWQGSVLPAIKSGRDPIPREEHYALLELLHAVRDNLNVDLRESAARYFKNLPMFRLLSYYPATYPAPEGEYRIPAAKKVAEPDVRQAALSRAADLSMVALDANAPESQYLQGWLLNDHFQMRGAFGSPYEFLWANPYQPGLSYFHVPMVWHDPQFGRLFARSSWDESAAWLGFFDGQLQLFQDGRVTVLDPRVTAGPLAVTRAIVYFGSNASKFRALIDKGEQVFVLGLKPHWKYDVEVDGEEMTELETDAGGVLEIPLPAGVEIGVRLRPHQES